MIKITSFYPFRNFLRVDQDFCEDKVIVKMKSLTYEREYEVNYLELDEISDKYHMDESQIAFGFGILALITFALIFFFRYIYETPTLLKTIQVLYICGFIVLASGFKKNWQINFSNRKGNILTYTKQTKKNMNLVSQATELITNKVKTVQEITSADPFPDEKPVFENVEYNIARFGKTTEKLYDDKLITFIQTFFKEVAYSTKYSEFSGKIFRGRVSAIPWFSYFCNLMYIGIIIFGVELAFGVEIGLNILIFFRVLFILFIVCWLLSFIKRSVVGLYDHDENILYWTFVNHKNKEKAEKIIKFIQSKIPAGERGLTE